MFTSAIRGSSAASSAQVTPTIPITQLELALSAEKLVHIIPTAKEKASWAWSATVGELRAQAIVITLIFLAIWATLSLSIAVTVGLVYVAALFLSSVSKQQGAQGTVQALQQRNLALNQEVTDLTWAREKDKIKVNRLEAQQEDWAARATQAYHERNEAIRAQIPLKDVAVTYEGYRQKTHRSIAKLREKNDSLARELQRTQQTVEAQAAQLKAPPISIPSSEMVDPVTQAQRQRLTSIYETHIDSSGKINDAANFVADLSVFITECQQTLNNSASSLPPELLQQDGIRIALTTLLKHAESFAQWTLLTGLDVLTAQKLLNSQLPAQHTQEVAQ